MCITGKCSDEAEIFNLETGLRIIEIMEEIFYKYLVPICSSFQTNLTSLIKFEKIYIKYKHNLTQHLTKASTINVNLGVD